LGLVASCFADAVAGAAYAEVTAPEASVNILASIVRLKGTFLSMSKAPLRSNG